MANTPNCSGGDPWKKVGPALVIRTLGKIKDLTVYNKSSLTSKVRPLKYFSFLTNLPADLFKW